MSKLQQLSEDYGFSDIMEMLEAATFDSVSPAICTNDGCDYSTDMEPDQSEGWCENCDTNTVKSALILAGCI
jgi:hypothetical protein